MGDAPLRKDHIVIPFFQPVPPDVVKDLQSKFPDADITTLVLPLGEDIPSDVAQKATYIVTYTNLPRPEDTARIQLIHFISAGIDHSIHHPTLQSPSVSVPITTSSGIHGPSIAEWVVMNWLVASRSFLSTYHNQQRHHWGGPKPYLDNVHDQVGLRLGILGYGSIGRQIARVASALGMVVHAHTASPRLTPESRRDTGYIVPGTGDRDGSIPVSWHHGTDRESIRAFLSTGLDHLVVALPLTAETTRVLGRDEFQLLSSASAAAQQGQRHNRPKPYITNIARGKVLDQDALIEALRDGVLSGAALDVTDPEPLPADHALWEAPNCLISPHVSSLGVEYFPRALDVLRENLDRRARGEKMLNEFKRGRAY